MPAMGFKVITIRKEAYDALYDRYKAQGQKFLKFATWTSQYLMDVVEADSELSKHMPYLALASDPHDNIIEIVDRLHGDAIYPVQIKDRRLYCVEDERDDCIHVGACFAIRKTAQVLQEHGFKPPKVK